MKKVLSTVVALALVSSVTAAASAANKVWFQMNGSANGPACGLGAQGPGGAGSKLSLTMNDTAVSGSCTWPIRLMLDYQGNGSDDGIYGWALDLYTDSGPTKVTAAFTTYQSTVAFPTANEFAPNGPNPPYTTLLTGKGRTNNAAPNPFGTYALMDFTITKTKNLGDHNTANIYVRIGNGAFGVNDPTFTQSAGGYQFGNNPNPNLNDENGDADRPIGPNPLISIVNTPEPATLSLLALGGLALIRRRR